MLNVIAVFFRGRRGVIRLGVIGLITAIFAFSVQWGLALRHDIWFNEPGARFAHDVSNGFYWGSVANKVGLLKVYDGVAEQSLGLSDYELDYPPLRLVVVYAWVKWAHIRFPAITEWENNYDLTLPMLRLNTLAELTSAILVFAIVILWKRRDRRLHDGPHSEPPWHCGLLCATIGALVLWFNPALLWNGHSYPQWDVWLVPFFLAAVLLCSVDCWILAGVCLAMGACFKGQMLLATPVTFLWPLCQFRLNAAGRLAAGFLATIAIIVSPWMLRDEHAVSWCILSFLAGVMAVIGIRFHSSLRWWLLAWLPLCFLMVFPWTSTMPFGIRVIPAGILVVACILFYYLKSRWKIPFSLLLISALVFLAVPLFGASLNWYSVGFAYGTRKFDFMLAGTGAYNVPTLIRQYWAPKLQPMSMITIPWLNLEAPFTSMMRWAYVIPLLMAGIGAALQDRWKSSRLLIAMVLPWLWSFLLLTQMHGRYLIWGSAMVAVLWATDLSIALLGLLIILIAWMGGVHNQIKFIPGHWNPEIFNTLNRVGPSMGWIVLLIGLIFLYVSMLRDPRRWTAFKSDETQLPLRADADTTLLDRENQSPLVVNVPDDTGL